MFKPCKLPLALAHVPLPGKLFLPICPQLTSLPLDLSLVVICLIEILPTTDMLMHFSAGVLYRTHTFGFYICAII